MLKNLHGMRVLVAEDEYLIARELARRLEGAGATILGPTPTIEQTLRNLSEVTDLQAAVLDINLQGELSFPVADELARRSIPFVFFTGYEDIVIPERFRQAYRVRKPADWSELLRALFDQRARSLARPQAQTQTDAARHGGEAGFVPQLRLTARILLGDAEAADRLVELTLERAIVEVGRHPKDMPVEAWLHDLLERTYMEEGGERLN